MSAWVYLGCAILSFISFMIAIWSAEARLDGPERSEPPLPMVVEAAVGAALIMVPLFYLWYVGMIPKWRYGMTHAVLNLLLPFLWAHLAIYTWRTGKGSSGRYAVGITFFLTVPVLFLGIWVGAIVRFRYSVLLVDWSLLLTGIALAWGNPVKRLVRAFQAPGTRP